jgi:hypothetical protein
MEKKEYQKPNSSALIVLMLFSNGKKVKLLHFTNALTIVAPIIYGIKKL